MGQAIEDEIVEKGGVGVWGGAGATLVEGLLREVHFYS